MKYNAQKKYLSLHTNQEIFRVVRKIFAQQVNFEKKSKTSKDFELFFKTYYFRFYSYALHIIDNEEEARDIVSDCFEYIWNHQTQHVDNWATYAYSYIRNKSIDYLRHQDVTRKYADFYFQVMEEERQREKEMSDRMTQIKEALAQLPTPIKQVVNKSFFDQKTYKEIGTELGISESMVKKRMAKALDFIRNRIAKKNK